MSEPGAVAGTIAQSNAQGSAPTSYFPAINVSATGTDTVPSHATNGGVGFNDNQVVGSKEGTGQTGENDSIQDEFQAQQAAMVDQIFDMDNLGESPYYKYHTRELSSGNEQKDQKRYGSRSLGRGMNMDNIRNGVYYGESEAAIFTWGLSAKDPNITKGEVEKNEVEDVRDV